MESKPESYYIHWPSKNSDGSKDVKIDIKIPNNLSYKKMSGEGKFVYEPSWALSPSDFSTPTSETGTTIRLNNTVEDNVKTSEHYFKSKLKKGSTFSFNEGSNNSNVSY